MIKILKSKIMPVESSRLKAVYILSNKKHEIIRTILRTILS